jgi:hypothetical protein
LCAFIKDPHKLKAGNRENAYQIVCHLIKTQRKEKIWLKMEGDNDETEQLQERKDDSEVGNVICRKKEEGKNDVGGDDPLTNTEEAEKHVDYQGEEQGEEEEKQKDDSSQPKALASQPDKTSHYPGEEKNDIIPVEAEGQQAAMRLNKLPVPPCTPKKEVTQGRLHVRSGKGGYADLRKNISEQGEGQQPAEDEQEAANTMVTLLMECKNGSDKGARDSEEDDLPIIKLKDHRRGKKRKERTMEESPSKQRMLIMDKEMEDMIDDDKSLLVSDDDKSKKKK